MFYDNEHPTDSNTHLLTRFKEARQAGRAPRTLVIGHRGGFLDGPENSMRAFRAAMENNLDGIEFDVSEADNSSKLARLIPCCSLFKVWLSKDNVLMIMHGGSNGELNHYGAEGHVYERTKEQL